MSSAQLGPIGAWRSGGWQQHIAAVPPFVKSLTFALYLPLLRQLVDLAETFVRCLNTARFLCTFAANNYFFFRWRNAYMNSALLQSGTEIAYDLRTSPNPSTITDVPVNTIGDLLTILEQRPPRSLAMLKTTCGLLGVYLNQPRDQILLDTVDARRSGFRQFLVARKYAENSIRAYVFQTRFLINTARRLGWRPSFAASEEWNLCSPLHPKDRSLASGDTSRGSPGRPPK